jgi:hypothetical protein
VRSISSHVNVLAGALILLRHCGREGVFRANGEVSAMKQSSSIDVGDMKALRRLVDRMGSLLPWRRQKARADLLTLGREAVDPLLTLYRREEGSRKGRTSFYTYLAGGTIAFALFSVTGLLFTGSGFWGGLTGLALLLLILVLPLGTIQSETRRQALLANALALYDDPRVIGPLTQALHFKQGSTLAPVKTRKPAMEALTSLLPRLESDMGDLLDAQQRDSLYRELVGGAGHYSRDHSFKLAILAGLRAIGDIGALPYVRRLEARYERLPAADLKRAIRHCLEILEPLADQERNRQMLLRATASEAETPQTVLLRAAQGAPATDPQQLLRATEENTTQI